jgi:hypothetical protein
VKSKATEQDLVELPAPRVRATGTGARRAHVTWLTPSEGTTRLLATLDTRADPGSIPSSLKQRLGDWATTHACSPILF